ncbi:MAG: hypothetical protein V1904_11190 [Bacteroidota bacterium]
MNNRLNNIFSETDCLSSGILIAYAEGRLEADEKHLVEKHLLDCQLCADALEGISSLKDKSKLKTSLAEISEKIDRYSKGRKTRIIHFDFRMRMAAAAVLLVFVGVTFLFRYYLIKQDREMVAQRTVEESYPDKKEKDKITLNRDDHPNTLLEPGLKDEKASEETRKVTVYKNGQEQLKGANENITFLPKGAIISDEGTGEAQQTFAGYYRSTIDANFSQSDTEKDTLTDISKDNDGTLAYDKSEKRLEEAEQKNEVTMVSETKATTTVTATAGSNNNKTNAPEKNTKKDLSKEKNNETPVVAGNTGVVADELMDQRYASGLQLYQNADYSGCLTQMQSYLGDASDDHSAYYYCGVSQYFLGQYDSAITSLSKVLKDKKNSFYETAQWYLSLSYIGKNDTSEAEKTWKDIVKAKGSFKTQAEEKLLEIEDK